MAASDTKGANGLIPCFSCANVYGRMHEQQVNPLCNHDDTGILVDITCNDTTKFVPREDNDFWHAADVLAALKPRLGKGSVPRTRKSEGPELQPVWNVGR